MMRQPLTVEVLYDRLLEMLSEPNAHDALMKAKQLHRDLAPLLPNPPKSDSQERAA